MAVAPDNLRRSRPLLGTFVEIATSHAAPDVMELAVEEAFEAVARVHRLMSFHEPTSDVSRLNREAALGAVVVDPWTWQVLDVAVALNRRSAGVFDVAVAPALQAMGLLPASQLDRARGSSDAGDGEAIKLLPGHRVRFLDASVSIDLGGIAKGFAVDRALDVLRRHGLPRGIVNAGGDLAAFGPDHHTVSIRDPRDPYRLLCDVHVTNEALASSGGCSDLFEPLQAPRARVVDPRTQRPTLAIAGATVRASDCMTADALTKVVMILGDTSIPLLDHYRASALVVGADGQIDLTSSWQGATLAACNLQVTPLRLDPTFRWAVYGVLAVLVVTGAVWLLADAFKDGDGGETWQAIAANLLMVHGGAAMVALLFLGALFPLHMRRGWRARKNRISGSIMATINALLIVTAFGLYYSGSEVLRAWTGDLHIAVGFALPVLILVHVVLGRRNSSV
jgi:thiamine biosynthesis lipoprotein